MKMVTLVKNGQLKQVPSGFSWTTLLFGALVPLYRLDFLGALFCFALSLATGGISHLVFPFFYNRAYLKKCLASGYEPFDDETRSALSRSGVWRASSL